MNTPRILMFVLLMALLLVAAASTSASARQDLRDPLARNLEGLNSNLSWTVFGAGGGRSASASYSIEATLGQSFVGPSIGTTTNLAAGFWQTESAGYRVLLPIVLK